MEIKTSRYRKRKTHTPDEKNQQKIAIENSNHRPTKLSFVTIIF